MDNPWEIAGRAIQSLAIELPETGTWIARVTCHGTEPLPASVRIECQNGGGPFVGTVASQSSTKGYVEACVQGGAGGLGKAVKPKGYKNTTSAIVARELSGETGELLDTRSTASASLPFYCRLGGSLSDALHTLSQTTGEPWHVTTAGRVFLGSRPNMAHETKAYFLSDDDSTNSAVYAVDRPEFEPGQTVDGKRIRSVSYELAGSLRATVFYK